MTDPVSQRKVPDRFVSEMFPQKVAFLWNHILVEPYEGKKPLGGQRMGRHTAQTFAQIRMAVKVHATFNDQMARPVGSIEALRAWTEGLRGPRVLETLQDWADLFAYMSRSDFLMGYAPSRSRPNWKVSLPWLLEPRFLFRVSNGDFHRGRVVGPSPNSEVPREWDPVALQAYSPFRQVEGS